MTHKLGRTTYAVPLLTYFTPRAFFQQANTSRCAVVFRSDARKPLFHAERALIFHRRNFSSSQQKPLLPSFAAPQGKPVDIACWARPCSLTCPCRPGEESIAGSIVCRGGHRLRAASTLIGIQISQAQRLPDQGPDSIPLGIVSRGTARASADPNHFVPTSSPNLPISRPSQAAFAPQPQGAN